MSWHEDDFLRQRHPLFVINPELPKTSPEEMKRRLEGHGDFINKHRDKLLAMFGAQAPRVVPSKDEYYISLLAPVASRSKDTNQVGCIAVGEDGRSRITAYNGFPESVVETVERWAKPSKYDFVVHAEANLVATAAKVGIPLAGCTAYVSFAPCTSCAKLLIAAGITRVVVDKANHEKVVSIKWAKDQAVVDAMFAETGVELIWWEKEKGR